MPSEGASTGSVYVDVLPSSEGFFAKFQAQTSGQAAKVGSDLGAIIAKAMADRIASGVGDGVAKGARDATGKSSAQITAHTARTTAELDLFSEKVHEIGRLNPTVHIDTNAASAAAEVESVKGAADRSSGVMGALLA